MNKQQHIALIQKARQNEIMLEHRDREVNALKADVEQLNQLLRDSRDEMDRRLQESYHRHRQQTAWIQDRNERLAKKLVNIYNCQIGPPIIIEKVKP